MPPGFRSFALEALLQESDMHAYLAGTNNQDNTLDIVFDGQKYRYYFTSAEEALRTFRLIDKHSRGKAIAWIKKHCIRWEKL